jgi:VIT1/CCC1 family predicted Fe2+/Mn2+ transporter
MAVINDTRSISQLISDLTSELSTLFRKESQLVRAELNQKFSEVTQGIASMAAGGVLLFMAGLFVLAAAAIGLAEWMPLAAATLLVGVAVGVIGAILLMVGRKHANPGTLKPERAVRQAQKDISMVREQVR